MPFKNEERIFPRDYEDRIFCEDCLIFMKGIPNESVSLILTDPPLWHPLQQSVRKESARHASGR